jgi:hypothetical protein
MPDPATTATASIHRDRFIAMLNHREPDRVPIAFGGPSCAIHVEAHRRLLAHLGYAGAETARVIDRILQIVEPDTRLWARFDVDVVWLIPDEGPVVWSPDGESYVDELGREFRRGGSFFNQVGSPLRQHEFGRDFGFFGGGIDNEVLSFGSTEDVRRDARRQIRALAPGGGYLYATIHNIPPEAPPENVVAFFDTCLEYGMYPIQ